MTEVEDRTKAESKNMTESFDPWKIPLAVLADAARKLASPTVAKMTLGADQPARDATAKTLLEILQARATLEAAEVQRQAIEAQTEKTASLVRVTWALVAVTAILATAAIVALFLVPDIVVELPPAR